MNAEFDPIKQGIMWAKVERMESEIAEIRKDMKELLELANKSKGGFWAGMVFVSAVSGIVGFFTHHIWDK
jgi:hypothetical protein